MSALRWGFVLRRRPFMQEISGQSRPADANMARCWLPVSISRNKLVAIDDRWGSLLPMLLLPPPLPPSLHAQPRLLIHPPKPWISSIPRSTEPVVFPRVSSFLMDTVLWMVRACRYYPSVYRVSSWVRCARGSAALLPSCQRLKGMQVRTMT